MGTKLRRLVPTIGMALAFIASMLVLPGAPATVALGPCTIRWVGANGAWETAANWRDVATAASRVPVATDTVCIDDANPLTTLVVTASTKTIAGLDNAEELRLSGSLTIGEGGEVVNRGVTELSNAASVVATSGGVAERFVNHGTLRTATGPAYTFVVGTGVTMEPAGTVHVQDGTLLVADVGVWPGSAATVAEGATLRLQLDAASDPHGDWTATGDGTVVLEGTVQPKTGPLVLGFPAGRLSVSGTLDGTHQPIRNAGVLPLGSQTLAGDAAAGVGVVNLAGGEVRQSGQVTLAEAAVVANDGLWELSNAASVVATSGGVAERFVNHGTLRTATGPAYTFVVGTGVTMEPAGTVHVQDGTLLVADVGVWPGSAATVAEGATLRLQLDAASDPHGDWTATGDGTVVLEGTVQPKTGPLVLGFPAGRLSVSGTLDGTHQPIRNAGVLPLGSQSLAGDAAAGVGVVNLAGGEVRQSGQVTLAEAAVVANDGLWELSNAASVVATSGGVAERFVNHGTLRTATGPAYTFVVGTGVTMEPAGTVHVQDGTLLVADVGVWPGSAATVAEGATLRLQLDAASDPHGDWTATGDGTVVLEGTVQPKTGPLVLGFPAGRLSVSGTLDGTHQPIRNAGVLPLGSQTLAGDAAAGVGVVNLAGGEVRQSGQVTLAEAAVVANDGLWELSNAASVVATSGGVAERFVNHGTLRTATGPAYTFVVGTGVTMEPAGTVHVQAGSLTIADPVPQVSGSTLTGGTWRVAGGLNLSAAPILTSIGPGASVELIGGGTFPKLSGLATNHGSLRLAGGKDLTTGALDNSGTLALGPASRLSVNGAFTTSGRFITGIAGLPASGQYGDVVATSDLALGGTASAERDAAYSPSPTDVFTVARGANVASQFAVVDTPGFTPSYTATVFVLNGTGSVPMADAGPDISVSEATPAPTLLIDGSGSTDADGTIESYSWTASDGIVLTGAAAAQAGFPAADDASFIATLEVCDDDGLCDTDTAQVTVANAAPTIALDPVGPVVQRGVAVTVTGTYTDAGGLDTHSATVDWGPGSPESASLGTGAISATNTYATTGPRTIEVCVTDDNGATTCATADITVVGPEPPVAVDDAATTNEDTPVDIDVVVNDTDPDTANDQLAVASPGGPGRGVTDVVGRIIRYTPSADLCGADSFVYTVTDGELTDTATVNVDVACVNDAPVADAGSDRILQEGNAQLLDGSASDADGDALIASWSPAAGLDNASQLRPQALAVDDAVTTTYTLTVCDAGLLCDDDTATLTITNATPSVSSGSTTVAPGVPVNLAVAFTDAGSLDTHTATFSWPEEPITDLGAVTSPVTLPVRTFTEPGTYVGQLCVTDDDGAIGCANQSVTVRSDAPPDAVDDAFDIPADSQDNGLDVLANDTDADRDPLTIVANGTPSAGGTVTCTTSSCSYTPQPGFRGAEAFTYTVADDVNGEDSATVTLTVRAPNRLPVGSLGLTPTAGIAPLEVTAAVDGTDPDGDSLQAVLDWGDGTQPVTGTLPLAAAPAHTYTASGTYVLRLAISDAADSDVTTTVVRVGSPEPLVAAAGDDQVVALGEPVRLDGSATRPIVGIDDFGWVVRDEDGDAVAAASGPAFDWTPNAAGTYTASLTAALAGEQDVDTAVVTVVDPTSEPGLAVTVRGSGAPLDGADVLAVDADGVRFAGVTGADGTTRLLGLPDGGVAVYAFAPGYLPAVNNATVTDGSGSLEVGLSAGEVAQTHLESRRLTIDEIIAHGIDPNDPANQNVFEFEIHLAFTPDDPAPTVFTGIASGDGIYEGAVGGGGGGGGFGVGSGVAVGGYTVYPTVRSVGGQPVIIWLVIPGEARWLKEFFEVRMVVSNLAPQPFTFAAGTASLDGLPDGLSLAPTAEPQQLVQSVADIPAGGSASATWIVRGDEAGDYELSATYAASLEPIGSPLSLVARTTPGALKVWGGDALFMRVLAEERLSDGHPYRVVVEMENISDIPIYNLAVELKEEGKLNYIYQPREELTRSIAELAPGETLTAEYVLVPTVGIFTPLELLEEISFVKKTGGNVDIASEILSVPPRFPDDQRPAIAVSRAGTDVTITWDAVLGATDYQLFTTTAPEIAFGPTPIATLPAGTTSVTIPLTVDLVGKHLAVSPTVNGRPDMVHRRVALLGGSYRSIAEEPSVVDRLAVVGDGLLAGAGLPGGDGCGRSAGAFAALLAGDLGVGSGDLLNAACGGAAAGNVAFAPSGPSLDGAYVTGPQVPFATVTQAGDVGAFAAGGEPDLVLAGFGAEDLGLDDILGQCGHGCDTRWRFTAQQLLRDRVYPRVYENLRALRSAHPEAVVVAFAYPTPVGAGSACSTFGTGGGITSAESTFLADELYPWLQTTMRRAAINAGVNLVDVTPAVEGHQACDPEPWVNGLLFDGSGALGAGSFLPNGPGHSAIASYLQGVVVDADGRLVLDNPDAQVVRVLAPQEEAPFVVPVTAQQAGACEAGTCPLRITVAALRAGDRIDLLVDGVAPVPAEAAAGPNGTVDVTVLMPAPSIPTTVVVEVTSIDRNLTGSAVATIGLPVNRPPAAAPDTHSMDEDGIAIVDVALNDADPDADLVTVLPALVTGPAHGTAVVEDDAVLGRRVVRYQPAAGYCGQDAFTYELADPGDLRSTATVTVTVACVNDAPALVGSAPVTMPEGTPVAVSVDAIDSDSSTLTYSWSPATGLNDPTLASPTFTSTDDGPTTFSVTVCDDGAPQGCTTLAHAAEVIAANVAPTVTAATDATAVVGVPLALDPIATFNDPGSADTHSATIAWGDGSVESVSATAGTVAGTHTFLAAGSYSPEVCVTDDDAGSACDRVTVTVHPAGPRVSVGDAQVGEPDSGTVSVLVPVSLSVAPATSVSIRVETVDGSAVAGSDYTAKTATVAFTPTGLLTKTVAFAVRGDLLAEPDETFSVRVVEPVTIGVADGTGTVTIANDDVCTVLGTAGNDTLNGTSGDDVICALAGDDIIDGQGGNDDIRGDTGVDTVTYLTAPAGVVVSLADGTATDRGSQILSGIEQVYGSGFDDTLTGGSGSDLLVGLGGADRLAGGLGNDELDGGDGADALSGGDGNDVLFGGDGSDQLLGQAGTDRVEGEAGDDTIDGGDHSDVLRGGSGLDAVAGGLGSDRIDGQAGDDTIDAGDGNDIAAGGDGADQLDGGLGIDDLAGGAGNDVVRGGDGNDTIQGDDDDDSLSGGLGDDLISGDDGDDTLAGDGGRDRLNGGRGTNALDGGDGVDSCRLGSTVTACERP